jgi:cystathionine gamma-lyase
VRDEALIEELLTWRIEAGAIPGPFEIWLAHRSLATLDVRLERGCANALAIAEYLSARDDVDLVRYPGLPSDPAHALASRQMRHYGTVVGFELATAERAQAFLATSELIAEATSFGGVHSSAERRARWGGDAIGEGYIRFSAGCETSDDLIADIGRALDQTASV